MKLNYKQDRTKHYSLKPDRVDPGRLDSGRVDPHLFLPLDEARFSPWNYFTGGSGNSVTPEAASESISGLFLVVVDAQLSGNKRRKSVATVTFLTASLLG